MASLLGSTVAGMAFGNSDVGAVHCLGESVGALYDAPHGVANAVFLPLIMEFNVASGPREARSGRPRLGSGGSCVQTMRTPLPQVWHGSAT